MSWRGGAGARPISRPSLLTAGALCMCVRACTVCAYVHHVCVSADEAGIHTGFGGWRDTNLSGRSVLAAKANHMLWHTHTHTHQIRSTHASLHRSDITSTPHPHTCGGRGERARARERGDPACVVQLLVQLRAGDAVGAVGRVCRLRAFRA